MGKAVNGPGALLGMILHVPENPGPAADLPGPVATSSLCSWPLSRLERNFREASLGQTNLKLRSVK